MVIGEVDSERWVDMFVTDFLMSQIATLCSCVFVEMFTSVEKFSFIGRSFRLSSRLVELCDLGLVLSFHKRFSHFDEQILNAFRIPLYIWLFVKSQLACTFEAVKEINCTAGDVYKCGKVLIHWT